jgi:FkbM family methyltransferase
MRSPWTPTAALLASLVLVSCGPTPDNDKAPAAAPAATPASSVPSRRDILRTERKQYSQHDEEVIIRDFFQDSREGFFVDVGCAWPKKDSNTYYLEAELGWSGIGIDALPEYAQPWSNKRRNSKFFNYAVTDHSGSFETFYRSELPGISALEPRKVFGGREVKSTGIQVPTITLTKLLDDNGIKTIDLLSMDIELAEPLALAGFDIDRFKPRLACIEVHGKVEQQIVGYFASHGYERIERYREYDGVNYYFAPKAGGR